MEFIMAKGGLLLDCKLASGFNEHGEDGADGEVNPRGNNPRCRAPRMLFEASGCVARQPAV